MSVTTNNTPTRGESKSQVQPDSGQPIDESAEPRSNRLWTIPNALSAMRLVGSFVLMGLAVSGEPAYAQRNPSGGWRPRAIRYRSARTVGPEASVRVRPARCC